MSNEQHEAPDQATPEPTQQTPQEPAAQQPAQELAETAASDSPTEPLGDGGLKALKAEREARKAAEKTAQEALARVKAFEDRDKTELELLQERAATAETHAQQQTTLAWREALMTAHQISEDDAEVFLTGSDPEVLRRQAARLVELRTPQAAEQPPASRTPVEHLRPGAMPTPPEPTMADRIAAAEKTGDYATARSLKSQQIIELAKRQ